MPVATKLTSVEIPFPDGNCEAHVAVPTDGGKYPGVLYLMDAFGVRPVIDEWLERIASQGYVVLAPNLFYRSKPIPIVEDMADANSPDRRDALFQSLMPMMSLMTSSNLASDSETYLATLASQPESAAGKVGLAGYCFGARVAVKIAAAHPDQVSVLAGFHGSRLVAEGTESPHLDAPRLKAEVYMAYADYDQGATPYQQLAFAQALEAAGVEHSYETYKDAPHGYTMKDTAAYREDAAERHFRTLVALLDRCLK